jgi:hypothetical protein
VTFGSGDPRLLIQCLAILALISLVFPVQHLEREWIALAWAIEGFTVILLFRWVPNWRLPAFGAILLSGALIELEFGISVGTVVHWAS